MKLQQRNVVLFASAVVFALGLPYIGYSFASGSSSPVANCSQVGTPVGSIAYCNVPIPVTGLHNVKSISAGAYHSLALLNNGTVMAWGYNGDGELGNGSTTNSDRPVVVCAVGTHSCTSTHNELSDVKQVVVGDYFSLALLTNGKVVGWGANYNGQLGDGNYNSADVPVNVRGLQGAVALAVTAGADHSLALFRNGTVRAWGSNSFGQLGDGGYAPSDVPVAVCAVGYTSCSDTHHELTSVVAVAAGAEHSLALLRNGSVVAWGDNESDQLGIGYQSHGTNEPVSVKGLRNVKYISAAALSSMAQLKSGSTISWGDGQKLQWER